MSEDSNGKSYNDDELKDIMDEIENLEKEFMQDSDSTCAEPVAVKSEIDSSHDSFDEMIEPVSSNEPEGECEVEHDHDKDQVLKENPDSPIHHHEQEQPISINDKGSHHMKANGQTSLHCHGDMALDFSFEVQGHEAKLSVKDGGCELHVKGLHLVLDSSKGCIVEMPGGVKFEVPLTSESDQDIKKAS